MKVLLLTQGKTENSQTDYVSAFRKTKCFDKGIELYVIPFLGYRAKYGWSGFYHEVLRVNEEFKPDLVFFQYFHNGGEDGVDFCCRKLKESLNNPLIFGSIGDQFSYGMFKWLGRSLPRCTLQLAANADAMFSTSMGPIADELVRSGGKNIVFLPHGFGTAMFDYWDSIDGIPTSYDIVMVGGRPRLYSRRLLFAMKRWYIRTQTVNMLYKHYPERFVSFGSGWNIPCNRGCVDFKDQLRVYASARVAVDCPPPILDLDYYMSDRPYYILGAGSPLVMFSTPRAEKIFRPDEHAFFVNDVKDIVDVCERALSLSDSDLRNHRGMIRDFVLNHHCISHRVDTIMSVAEALLLCRAGKVSPQQALQSLRMTHFLSEINLDEEMEYCVINWRG